MSVMDGETPLVNPQTSHIASYQEILAEVGRQLSARKGLLVKRTLLVMWPFFILIALGVGLRGATEGTAATAWTTSLGIIFFAWLLISILYFMVAQSILGIEKII